MAKWVASISMFLRKSKVYKRFLFLDFPLNIRQTLNNPVLIIQLSFAKSDLKENNMKSDSINILLPFPPTMAAV
jgi:hypothetical protein